MNCVNCGAPPKHKTVECLYCGTALDKPEVRVDKIKFKNALNAMRQCTFDVGRDAIGFTLARHKTPFTAGQVRALAQTYAFDNGKVALFRMLMPYIINPLGVLECGDVMSFDSARMSLAKMVGGVSATPTSCDSEQNLDVDIQVTFAPVQVVAFMAMAVILTAIAAALLVR